MEMELEVYDCPAEPICIPYDIDATERKKGPNRAGPHILLISSVKSTKKIIWVDRK